MTEKHHRISRGAWDDLRRDLDIDMSAKRTGSSGDQRLKAKILVDNQYGDTFSAYIEALLRGEKVLSHPQLLEILKDPELFGTFKNAFPAVSSTGIAYPAPHNAMPHRMWCDKLFLEVPDQFKDQSDIALVLPNMKVQFNEDKRRFYLDTENVQALYGFPQESGWYLPDPEFGIPQGPQVNPESYPEAMYLSRSSVDILTVTPILSGDVHTSLGMLKRTADVSYTLSTVAAGVIVEDESN